MSLSSYFVFKLKSPVELLTIRNKNNQMCEEHVVTFSLEDLNGNYSKSNLATIIIGESKVTITITGGKESIHAICAEMQCK